ncbi:hypothetical protein GGX14DRAFT_618590 [Mycena pura]|uniref:DUF5648 domain-containing protein n=1 Tax=Mycena pura TaxID=153505 RepID=A0AAD6YCC6_9AGAR|nr:hypothetical protein GGX14DRAFT_618590 [Mycena pura]
MSVPCTVIPGSNLHLKPSILIRGMWTYYVSYYVGGEAKCSQFQQWLVTLHLPSQFHLLHPNFSMKFFFAVLLAAVTSVTGQWQCPSCPAIIPLFRSYSGVDVDHFYTATAKEVLSAGAETNQYIPEGIAAGIFPTQVAGSSPLFRLFKGSIIDHAYTASEAEVNALEEAGYTLKGSPGFVYTTQICNSVPLYGLFLVNNDHFYTTSAAEREKAITVDGYTDQNITAFVPVPGVSTEGDFC